MHDEEVKRIAEREHPSDYSMQKFIYEEQLEAKNFMQNSDFQKIDDMVNTKKDDTYIDDEDFHFEMTDQYKSNYDLAQDIYEEAELYYRGDGKKFRTMKKL